jgi:monovalent cation/proton antiporter MnhG/PhaG subunit
MSGFAAFAEIARHALAGALIALGLIGLAAGLAAQIRFPDFFTRLHGAAIGAAPALIVLAGLAVEAWEPRIAARLILLGGLIVALAPIRAHMLASGAHAAGLAPMVGAAAQRRRGA